MAIVLNDNINFRAPKPADDRYLNSSAAPYADVASAKSAIPVPYRFKGLTVNVSTDEYWWKSGTSDSDLILKTSGGGGFSNPMTTQGDLIVGGSSGTPQRLGIGTALQQIRVNAGGTDLEYFTSSSSGITFKEQSFTADGSTSTFVVSNGTLDQLSFVDINGNVQEKGVNYTVSGQNISFSTSIPVGNIITVHYAEGSGGGGGGGSVTGGNGITVSGSVVNLGGNIASDVLIESTIPNTSSIHFGQTNNLLSFDFTIGDGSFISTIGSIGSTISLTSTNSGSSEFNSLTVDVNNSIFNDGRSTPSGLQYASNGYVTTSTSLTDQGYIANLFNGVRGLALVNISPGVDTVTLGGPLASSMTFRDNGVGNIDIGFGTTGNRVRSFTTKAGNGSTLSDYTQSVSSFQWVNFSGSGSSQIDFASSSGWIYTDSNPTPIGMKYSADYRTGYGNRTIPDWGNVLSAKTYTGTQTFVAPTTSMASIILPAGIAPTSPTDGMIWYDGTNLKMRVGGTTKTFTLV